MKEQIVSGFNLTAIKSCLEEIYGESVTFEIHEDVITFYSESYEFLTIERFPGLILCQESVAECIKGIVADEYIEII